MDKATLIALGGQELEVAHNDGQTERVTVRLLKIAKLPRYFELAENEAALAAFVCAQEADWAESLTAESLLDICDAAYELNFRNARRWAERRARQNEALLPVAETGIRVRQALENSAPTAPPPRKSASRGCPNTEPAGVDAAPETARPAGGGAGAGPDGGGFPQRGGSLVA